MTRFILLTLKVAYFLFSLKKFFVLLRVCLLLSLLLPLLDFTIHHLIVNMSLTTTLALIGLPVLIGLTLQFIVGLRLFLKCLNLDEDFDSEDNSWWLQK